ncbi:hypothetical protein ACE0DR_27730 [Azotobacter sp. CWF10]
MKDKLKKIAINVLAAADRFALIISFSIVVPLTFSLRPQMGFLHDYGLQNDLLTFILAGAATIPSIILGVILRAVLRLLAALLVARSTEQ